MIVAIEYPLVAKDYFNSSDSYMARVAFYIPLCVMSLMEAQTVNGGLYLAIGTVAYMKAIRVDFLKHHQSSYGRMP